MHLSNNLKILRGLNGNLSQQQLADLIGCSRQTIICIESGKINPSLEIALKLSEALNTPVDEIFALQEGREKEKFCNKIKSFFSCMRGDRD